MAGVTVDPSVPLRIAAVRNGRIVAAQDLEPAKRAGAALSYRLRLPFVDPCSFTLVLGRADLPDRLFVASPLVQLRIPAAQLAREHS